MNQHVQRGRSSGRRARGTGVSALRLAGFAALLCGVGATQAQRDIVTADFSVADGPPLVRKFGVSATVEPDRHEALLRWMGPLSLASLRVELDLGRDDAWPGPVVAGEPGSLRYDWDALHPQADGLRANLIAPYWSYGYMPAALRGEGDWRSPASSPEGWAHSARAFTRAMGRAGTARGYEIWNRPDDPAFFTGTLEDYLLLLRAGMAGIRAGNSDAVMGGPSLGFDREWIDPFLDDVQRRNLPLDFFSFHAVDLPGGQPPYTAAMRQLGAVREGLARAPRFATTEIHLNAYSPVRPADASPGGVPDRYTMASKMLDDMRNFLREPDVALVHWHEAMDPVRPGPAYGLLDSDGNAKPALGALAIYADMALERVRATDGQVLRAMASMNHDRAGTVVWNPTGSDQSAEVRMVRFPFTRGTLIVYMIDRLCEGTDTPFMRRVDTRSIEGQNAVAWTGTVPAGGVVYLKIQPLERHALPPVAGGEAVRTHAYFADRGSRVYADVSAPLRAARLGMGGEEGGLAMGALTLDQTPETLHLRLERRGTWTAQPDRLCAVRMGYRTAGGYTHAVLYRLEGDAQAGGVDVPWGTRAAPRKTIGTGEGERIRIDVAGEAPEGWDGRTIITFMLRDTGPDSHAVIRMQE